MEWSVLNEIAKEFERKMPQEILALRRAGIIYCTGGLHLSWEQDVTQILKADGVSQQHYQRDIDDRPLCLSSMAVSAKFVGRGHKRLHRGRQFAAGNKEFRVRQHFPD